MKDIRDYLKPIRRRLGIKQCDFAEMLGVGNVTLNLWEHKRHTIRAKKVREILRILKEKGVNINEFEGN